MLQHTPWERFVITLDRTEELGLTFKQRILVLAVAAQVASGIRPERMVLEAFERIGETASRLLEVAEIDMK